MKISDACRVCGLTERAVRLYIQEGLLEPRQHNGIMNFSQEDIRRLREIALLRRYDFSIAQIRIMLSDEQALTEVLEEKIQDAQERINQNQHILMALQAVKKEEKITLEILLNQLAQAGNAYAQLNFSQFDELSAQERMQLEIESQLDLEQQGKDRRKKILRNAIIFVLFLILLAGIIIIGKPDPNTAFLSEQQRHQMQLTLQEYLRNQNGPTASPTQVP